MLSATNALVIVSNICALGAKLGEKSAPTGAIVVDGLGHPCSGHDCDSSLDKVILQPTEVLIKRRRRRWERRRGRRRRGLTHGRCCIQLGLGIATASVSTFRFEVRLHATLLRISRGSVKRGAAAGCWCCNSTGTSTGTGISTHTRTSRTASCCRRWIVCDMWQGQAQVRSRCASRSVPGVAAGHTLELCDRKPRQVLERVLVVPKTFQTVLPPLHCRIHTM